MCIRDRYHIVSYQPIIQCFAGIINYEMCIRDSSMAMRFFSRSFAPFRYFDMVAVLRPVSFAISFSVAAVSYTHLDNRAHGADAMGPAGAVMSDGGCDTLVEGLVQGGDGKVAVDALLDVGIFPGHPVAVEAVHDFTASVSHVIGYDGHGAVSYTHLTMAAFPMHGSWRRSWKTGCIIIRRSTAA